MYIGLSLLYEIKINHTNLCLILKIEITLDQLIYAMSFT